MDELKLLPCPFCGNNFPTLTYGNTEGWKLRCPSCNITLTRDYYEHRGEFGKQRLIEAWNRRAEK